MFHEWLLDKPGDILQVYFLIRNIDKWTVGKFRERVEHGVGELVKAIVHKKQKFSPWRRVGDLSTGLGRKENINISTTVTSSSSAATPPPPKPKTKRRRAP
jgi:solute carrier family 25 carnitine/acylcarnitine transporter 20/29